MSDALTLSEILSRGVSLEWPEGVAVVRAAIESLTTRGQTGVAPDLDQIQILATGRVEVSRGIRGEEPIRRFGQLLHATIANADPPVKLRLTISEAMAPSPVFASIREYDQALEYFERPGREALLRALFARASALPASEGSQAPTLNAVAPLSSTAPETPRPRRRKRRAAPSIAAAALIVLSIAWFQYLRGSGSEALAGEIPAVALRVTSSVGPAMLSGLSTITERVGLGRIVPQSSGGRIQTPVAERRPPRTAASPAGAARTPSIRPAAPPSPASESAEAGAVLGASAAAPPPPAVAEPMRVLAFDLEPRPGSDHLATSPLMLSPEAPSLQQLFATRVSADLTVYSMESAGVEPPVAVRPQLPTELPPHIPRDGLITIELIVSAEGRVNSVKLLGEPRMSDGMWLSAVKAWQFRPALRNGDAVTFRKTVWIAAGP